MSLITRRLGAFILLGAALVGCTQVAAVRRTFELREVQDTFAAAVAADNTATIDPFLAGQSERLYAEVKATLTDAQIAALDPRLQANAWLLRAVAAWRTRDPATAISAAARGLEAPGLAPQSRDQVLLALVPALAIDSELRERLAQQPGPWSAEAYEGAGGARADFTTAITRLDEAAARIGPATPAAVIHYVAYQRWRLLTNWRYAINRLDTREARQAAQTDAATLLAGETLAASIDAVAAAIPESEPLRQLLERQRIAP